MIRGELIHRIVLAAFLKCRLGSEDLAHVATFFAGVIPPIPETRHRTKSISRSVISGMYSNGCENTSPTACGVVQTCRICLYQASLLRRQHILDEEHLQRLQAPAELRGVHSGQVRMNVVAELRRNSDLGAHLLEHLAALVRHTALRRTPDPVVRPRAGSPDRAE